MKSINYISLSVAAVCLAVSAGCSTFESRAKEKSATFNLLSPRTQDRLERGTIRVGDTEDMVYIALGRPDQKSTLDVSDARRTVWTYNSYWQQYEGTQWLGFRRVIVPTANGYVVYHEPITTDIYREHVEEQIRVTLQGGKVVSVEQRKDS